MRLGRISAPIPNGVPTLDQHPIASVVPPPVLRRDHIAYRLTSGGNDICGDCTAAAVANALHAQAALGGMQLGITDQQCIDLYSAASGYDPGRPETDRGCIEVDMLAYQAANGFQADAPMSWTGLWANIHVDNLDLLRAVTVRMGCAYLGLNLAVADQQGDVWDTGTPAFQGDSTPGSWGGHAAILWSYDGIDDTSICQIATWGLLQRATWRWVRSRMEEAHLLCHPQLIGPDGRFPTGVNRDRLCADVASFGAIA